MNSDMNEITDNMPASEAQQKFTLKVLFGPMFGCELHLPADDYFLIINPGPALQDTSNTLTSVGEHAASFTQNTLYLPCDRPSPNLILRLSTPLEDADIRECYGIEVLGVEQSFPAQLFENEVFVHEHIRFAVKRSGNEWPEDIKNFNLPPTLDAECGGVIIPADSHVRKKHSLIIGGIIIFALLFTVGVIWHKEVESDKQVLSLNDALTGAPTALEIVRGRDNDLIYVLTTKHQAFEWVQEAIFKLKQNKSAVPIWLSRHRNEVISQLSNAGYPVLQIDYSTPQTPVISLYQALTTQEEEKFRYLVMKNIPFALDVKTKVKTKTQLLQEARQGLDRLHIHYRQINTSAGYALVVRDALSDHVLTALQHFIKEFNHQWGNRVINFSINLDENWLQDKSYVDASNGYLFLNPRHWYFTLR